MMINLGKVLVTVILILVTIQVAAAVDDPLFEAIDNVTGEGFAGTVLLGVVKTLYWLLLAAAVIVEFIFGFGLMDAMKKMDKLKF